MSDEEKGVIPEKEPVLTNEVVYDADGLTVRKIWTWNICSAYEDDETGLIKCLLTGPLFGIGFCTFITPDGKRFENSDFTDLEDYSDGVAWVRGENGKWGIVDTDMKLRIPFEYDWPDEEKCVNGLVIAKKGGVPFLFNKDGTQIDVGRGQYEIVDIESCYGLFCAKAKRKDDCCPETLILDGCGNIVSTKYVFISNEEEERCSDTLVFVILIETGKRGALDKDGKEVIPCAFDELGSFWDREDFFRARIDDKWGIIDRTGKWVVRPMFGDIDYDIQDDLIVFANETHYYDEPWGVYDIKRQKVLFEPQFKEVELMSKGRLGVKTSDKEKNETVKIIRTDGTVLYSHPNLSDAFESDDDIRLTFYENKVRYEAVLDKEMNEMLSGKHKIDIWQTFFKESRFIFEKDGKFGLMSFDLNVLIEPEYEDLFAFSWNDSKEGLFIAKLNEKKGLITAEGTTVLPFQYKNIEHCKEGRLLCTVENGPVEMYELEGSFFEKH